MTDLDTRHSFGPGMPDVVLSRATAVHILNQLEMWADVVAARVRRDEALESLIATLGSELERTYTSRY